MAVVPLPLSVRRVAAAERITRPRGAALGGPGPSPTRPEPARVAYRCGPCRHLYVVEVRRITLWILAAVTVPRRPAPLPGYEALGEQPAGFDAVCGGCGRPYRLLCEADEWGKNGAPFPRFVAVLEVAGRAARSAAGRP